MASCEQQHLLTAYHDGELDAGERARFEAHLRSCPSCARELELLRAASAPLAALRSERPTPEQWKRFHGAVNQAAEDAQFMRTAATLTVLAASVMVIGLAWLRVLAPVPPGSRDGSVATTPLPEDRAWERVATTLRPDPLSVPPAGDQTARRREADLADFMLQGLER